MSKLAGLLLILFGAAIAYLGLREALVPVNLTPYAAYTSILIGVLLLFAGISHFRAPHKSFLMTIPLLLAFQVHMYCIALFFSVERVWVFLGGFLIASVLILFMSYMGYRKKELEGELHGD